MRSNCCCDSHSTTRRVSCKKGSISSAARTRACSQPLLLLLSWDVAGWGDGVIVLESMQIRRPLRGLHFRISPPWDPFSKMCIFRGWFSGFIWTVSQNDAIGVLFRKKTLSSGRGLKRIKEWPPICGLILSARSVTFHYIMTSVGTEPITRLVTFHYIMTNVATQPITRSVTFHYIMTSVGTQSITVPLLTAPSIMEHWLVGVWRKVFFTITDW